MKKHEKLITLTLMVIAMIVFSFPQHISEEITNETMRHSMQKDKSDKSMEGIFVLILVVIYVFIMRWVHNSSIEKYN